MSPAAFLAYGIAIATVGYLYTRKSAATAGLIAGSIDILLGCAAALYGTYQLTTLPGRVVLITVPLAGLIWIGYHLATYCLDEKRPSTGMHAAAQPDTHV